MMENDKLLDFTDIKGKNKKIYKTFFANNEFVKKCLAHHQIYKTWWTGRGSSKYSDSSCSFVDGKNKQRGQLETEMKEKLVELFNPKSIERFNYCFDEAVSGSGHEWKKMATLHSSSLISLLCFYQISEKNRLILNHKIGEKNYTFTFTNSEFEVKNKVGKGYSNIDIKLTGTDNEGESVALFLESKFSEYLTPKDFNDDSVKDKVYNDIYNQLIDSEQHNQPIEGISIQHDSDRDCWVILGKKHYCEGIKQMISHYVGITKSFISTSRDKYDKIYLGEILFKFPEEVYDKHHSYNSYVGLYEQLAEKLNCINKCKKFNVLKTPLSYQDVFKDFKLLDPNVREFYALQLK